MLFITRSVFVYINTAAPTLSTYMRLSRLRDEDALSVEYFIAKDDDGRVPALEHARLAPSHDAQGARLTIYRLSDGQ